MHEDVVLVWLLALHLREERDAVLEDWGVDVGFKLSGAVLSWPIVVEGGINLNNKISNAQIGRQTRCTAVATSASMDAGISFSWGLSRRLDSKQSKIL